MKKRELFLLVGLFVSLIFMSGFVISAYDKNDKPVPINDFGCYNISTCSQLQNMKNNLEGCYHLTKNIDCSDTVSWNSKKGFEPIGTSSKPFTGSILGGGFKISNLIINRPSISYTGLIGYSVDGYIKDLDLVNISVRGNNYVGSLFGYVKYKEYGYSLRNISVSGNVVGNSSVGGFIGKGVKDGSIRNSIFRGNVTGIAGTDTGNYIGGLVGYDQSGLEDALQISGSVVYANVSGKNYVGGVVGYCINGVLSCADFFGDVKGTNSVGGIAGYFQGDATIGGSYVEGTVTGSSANTGGIVGYMYSARLNINSGNYPWIYNSFSNASVFGKTNTGGAVGKNENGEIIRTAAIGNVTGSGNYVGGLVGYHDRQEPDWTSISNSYAAGKVVGKSYTGGLVGGNLGTETEIGSSYSIGNVTGSGNYVGGLVGKNTGKVTNSYYNKDTSGQWDSSKGTPKTDNQMKQQSTYEGFNFDKQWIISQNLENYEYPILKWSLGTILFSDEIDICDGSTNIHLFGIEDSITGSGEAKFNISGPEGSHDWCNLLINGTDRDFSKEFELTKIVSLEKNNSILYTALDSGTYSASVTCNCGPSHLAYSNEVYFEVFLIQEEGNSLSWKNLLNEPITKVGKGGTVVLDFPDYKDTNINYYVKNQTKTIYSGSTEKGFAYFKFPEEVLGDYNFSIKESSLEEIFSVHSITVSEDQNAPPKVGLDSFSIFSINSNVELDLTGTNDPDDLIDIEVVFGDRSSSFKRTDYSFFEQGNLDTQHAYSSVGSYLLKIFAKEKVRSQESSFSKNILILQEGLNIVPLISEPAEGEVLEEKWVKFETDSIAIYNCTLTSEENEEDCEGDLTDDNTLCCDYSEWEIEERELYGDNQLYVEWDFGTGLKVRDYLNETNKNSLLNVRTRFPNLGYQTVKLSMNYTGENKNVFGSSYVFFRTGSNEYSCESTPSSAFWKAVSTGNKFWIYGSNVDPSVNDMCDNSTFLGNETWCCPRDMYCEDGECKISEIGLVSCVDFQTKNSCNGAASKYADGFFELVPSSSYQGICRSEGTFESYLGDDQVLCSNVTYCGCIWNGTNDNVGTCMPSVIFESNCGGDTVTTGSCSHIEISREDLCGEEQGKIILKFEGISSEDYPYECEDIEMSYPCSKSVQLSFFNIWSFILVGLTILGVYFWIGVYRKKKNYS